MVDVNDQLDELLASFESTTPSPGSRRSTGASKETPMNDFDFLDSFLAEMESEKKPAPTKGGSAFNSPKASPKVPNKTSASTIVQPGNRAQAFLDELEDMVSLEKGSESPNPVKKPPVASPWKAVDTKLPEKPKEVSLDTSRDIRQLEKELKAISRQSQTVNGGNDNGKKAAKEDEDLEGFEVAKVKPKVATKAVSLDSPEELEKLQRELMTATASPKPLGARLAEPAHTTRPKSQPMRKPLIASPTASPPQQHPAPTPAGVGVGAKVGPQRPAPKLQQPVIQQAPAPIAVPVGSGIVARPAPAAAAPAATAGDQGGAYEDLDRLLDEISPATIKRIPDPSRKPAVTNDTFFVPPGQQPPPQQFRAPQQQPQPLPRAPSTPKVVNMQKDQSLEEMDALVGELDLNLTNKGVDNIPRRPSIALTSLDDLDELEKALGGGSPKPSGPRAAPKPAPVAKAPVAPSPPPESFGDEIVDNVMEKLDKVVQRADEVRGSESGARNLPAAVGVKIPPGSPDTKLKGKEKADQIAKQAKGQDQTHDYVSGWRQGGGGTLEENKNKVAAVEKNLDLILEDIDPMIAQRKLEQEQKEREAKEKKDAELNGLLSGLDEEYKAKQERERKQKEAEELDRKRRKEEEERRRQERKKMDLEAIEEMVENLSPVGFLETPVAAGTQTAVVTQHVRTHTEQTQEEKEYNKIQVKHKELARMTGQNLWTAKGDARIDIAAITDFLKASVVEARVVADQRGITDPKKKDEIIENCKLCLQTVPAFVSSMKKFHAATKANEDAEKSGIPVDKSIVDNILRECQVARMHMLKSYELLLESYIYSPDSTVTIPRATSTPVSVAGPGDAPIKLFKDAVDADPARDAKNAILYAFKDFYLGATESAPKPNTIEALSYVPWQPQMSMKEYCALSIAQFKEIVAVLNAPMKTFDFKLFSTVIGKEIELLVPIAKMINRDPLKYNAFSRFPLGTKVFVNACISFIDAVDVYKKKGVAVEALGAARGDADFMLATAKKSDLNSTLKMLLTVLQKILLIEKSTGA